MTATEIARHAMEFVRIRGQDHATENKSVAVVGPAKDFRIELYRARSPEGESTLAIILDRRCVFLAKLARHWQRDDAYITETDDSATQEKKWATRFLEIKP
jgi:hypothetical protein